MEKQFDAIQKIWNSIKEAGYDPYSQLMGYLIYHNENYVTRHLGSRNKIKDIPEEHLRAFLNQIKMKRA